jgi:hypothetical protein
VRIKSDYHYRTSPFRVAMRTRGMRRSCGTNSCRCACPKQLLITNSQTDRQTERGQETDKKKSERGQTLGNSVGRRMPQYGRQLRWMIPTTLPVICPQIEKHTRQTYTYTYTHTHTHTATDLGLGGDGDLVGGRGVLRQRLAVHHSMRVLRLNLIYTHTSTRTISGKQCRCMTFSFLAIHNTNSLISSGSPLGADHWLLSSSSTATTSPSTARFMLTPLTSTALSTPHVTVPSRELSLP